MSLSAQLPLRTKIISVTMLTAATALLLAGATLFLYEVNRARAKLERDLATIARIVGANSAAAISFRDQQAATETLTALRVEPQILGAGIYAQDGALFATFHREGFAPAFPPAPAADGATRTGDRLTYFGSIRDEREQRRVGTLYLEADFAGVRQRLGSYGKLLGFVLAASCLVALGLSALLQQYISRPIARLVRTMKRISAHHDYSLRVPSLGSDELGQLGEGFNEMLRQIEAAHQELEAFSYSVSHDLRAPVRAMDGYSSLLAREIEPHVSERGRHHLDVIRKSAKQMGQLIDDLLTLSRLGRQALRKHPVDVGALVQDVLVELGQPWPERHVEVRLGELPACEGDPILLRQVWVNLLSNALKYTGKREHAVLEIGSLMQKGETVYFVRDNGTGFDMQYADKLFGVFQRLHRAEDYEGTGVGLAIVRRIINRHGGNVWAEAGPDRGATFYFTIGAGPAP